MRLCPTSITQSEAFVPISHLSLIKICSASFHGTPGLVHKFSPMKATAEVAQEQSLRGTTVMPRRTPSLLKPVRKKLMPAIVCSVVLLLQLLARQALKSKSHSLRLVVTKFVDLFGPSLCLGMPILASFWFYLNRYKRLSHEKGGTHEHAADAISMKKEITAHYHEKLSTLRKIFIPTVASSMVACVVHRMTPWSPNMWIHGPSAHLMGFSFAFWIAHVTMDSCLDECNASRPKLTVAATLIVQVYLVAKLATTLLGGGHSLFLLTAVSAILGTTLGRVIDRSHWQVMALASVAVLIGGAARGNLPPIPSGVSKQGLWVYILYSFWPEITYQLVQNLSTRLVNRIELARVVSMTGAIYAGVPPAWIFYEAIYSLSFYVWKVVVDRVAIHALSEKQQDRAPASRPEVTTGDGNIARFHQCELNGYERTYAMTEGCVRIAHILEVTGPTEEILRHLVSAFRMVMNRHPKMRGRMSKEETEPMTFYVPPANMTDTEIMQKKLVTVVRHVDSSEVVRPERLLRETQTVCDRPVNRTVDYPYFLIADVPQQTTPTGSGSIVLSLYSDHTFSDGFSGQIVLADLLTNLRLLTIQGKCNDKNDPVRSDISAAIQHQQAELPLRTSIYEQLRGRNGLWKRVADGLITTVGEKFIKYDVESYKPILPIKEDRNDIAGFPLLRNKSCMLMDTGKKENLEAALAKCRQENVTLHGAITACVFLAFAKAKYPATSTIPDGKVKLSVDVAYNMRRRVKEPFPELTVGLQNDVATLPGLDKKGVDFSSRFWDVARTLKLLTDNSMQSPASMAQLIYCHHKLNPASTALKMTAKKGVLGDVTISNLGRWPFPSVYELVEGLDPIRVKALHLFCAEPYFGSCATLYVTGTDQLNYSMAYTMTDDVSSQVFGYMVKAIEAISTISSDESMQQVCERLLGQETFDQESVMA